MIGHVFIQPSDKIIFGEHAFAVYKLVALLMGGNPVAVEMPNLKHDLNLILEAITDDTKIIFLPSPNNPTGTSNTSSEIYSFVEQMPDRVILCLDEAYAEYLEEPPDVRPFFEAGKKVIGLRTFSKIHGLAGLRIGYRYSSREMISLLQKARQPFNANAVAQVTAIAALEDESWVSQCRRRNKDGLRQMEEGFKNLGLEFVPSQANFILVRVGNGAKAFESLQKKGIITRPMSKELSNYLRIIGTGVENEKALSALRDTLPHLKGLMISEKFSTPQLFTVWVIFILCSIFLGSFRTIVDRIRSGLIASPQRVSVPSVIEDCLRLPNHMRDLFMSKRPAYRPCKYSLVSFYFFNYFQNILVWMVICGSMLRAY